MGKNLGKVSNILSCLVIQSKILSLKCMADFLGREIQLKGESMKLDQEKKYNLLCKHSGKPCTKQETEDAEEKVSKKTTSKK